MANKIYYFRGGINWAKVHKPDQKYDIYTLDLYLDDESTQMFKDSGLQLKVREGEEGSFIKLRRPTTRVSAGDVISNGPPEVLVRNDAGEFEAFSGNIGNGSTGVCKVRVYDTDRGKGHELVTVAVETLVPYEGTEVVSNEDFPF